MLLKRSTIKVVVYEPTSEEIQAFKDLQQAFSKSTFLIHFDKAHRLYIILDASKVFGFAAMVYHVKNDPEGPFPQTSVQPIMFLSKCLNDAERNYWPTELEVAVAVWVVRKVRHMIDSTEKPPAIIYTDHSAAVPISRQTTLNATSTDRLNLRLVRRPNIYRASILSYGTRQAERTWYPMPFPGFRRNKATSERPRIKEFQMLYMVIPTGSNRFQRSKFHPKFRWCIT